MAKSPTKVITGPVRFAYPALAIPKPNQDGTLKYGGQLLIPKTEVATLKAMESARLAAIGAKFGAGVNIEAIQSTLRDGDSPQEDKSEDYHGHMFVSVNANEDRPPQCIDAKKQPMNPMDIRSGDWVRVSLNCYGWSHKTGGKGTSFGLNNVQWIKRGSAIGNASRAEDDFDDGWEDETAEEVDPFA